MTVEAIASRIDANPRRVAFLLDQERARGRVRRDGDRWSLVAIFVGGRLAAGRLLGSD